MDSKGITKRLHVALGQIYWEEGIAVGSSRQKGVRRQQRL